MTRVRRSTTGRQTAFVSIPLAILVAFIIVLLRAGHDLWAIAVTALGFLILAGLDRVANRSRAAAGSARRVR